MLFAGIYWKRKKKKTMVNQQGTLKKDSSETIRDKNFKIKKINKAFINWFLGFVEGNENVFIVNRRYLRFELIRSIKHQSIIYYIKDNLGFGNIQKFKFLDTIIVVFFVQENINELLILLNIFNGNLKCSLKEQQFKVWYNKLKVKLKKLDLLNLLPEYIVSIQDINLLNSWLLGYIDSRVLFYGRWHKSKKLKDGKELYLCCIFWHLNKDLLLKIKKILDTNSKVEEKLKWNLPFFKLVIDNIEDKNKIMNYLLKFKLKSKKKNRYKIWKILLDNENKCIETGVQDFSLIDKYLIKLSSTIEAGELSKI